MLPSRGNPPPAERVDGARSSFAAAAPRRFFGHAVHRILHEFRKSIHYFLLFTIEFTKRIVPGHRFAISVGYTHCEHEAEGRFTFSGGGRLLTSIIFAWLAVLFAVLSAVLYLIKRSGNKRLRRIFSRIHITVGWGLIITGVIHGILAGNFADSTLSDMMVAPVLFTWNWGTISLIVAALLAVSFMLRKRLRKQWMRLHRVLTVVLIAVVVLHVADVGVQVFDRLVPVTYAEAEAVSADSDTDTETETDSDTLALIDDTNALFSGATLIDGVYQGSATGYNGEITVSVAVSGGLVSDIEIVSENETPSYLNRAETVVNSILETQSLEVDAVSGATFSSAGIVNAVSDALSAAVSTGTLEVTEYEITYTARHGRHGH